VSSAFDEKQALSIIPKLAPESQPMTSQAIVRMYDREKALAKVESDIDQGATSAINANYLVNNLSSQASDFKMGKFAPIANKSREYLLGFNNLLGNPISEEELNKISSETGGYQAFQKNAVELARQVVRATSARAAYQEMQMIMNSLPSTEMTEQGFRIVSNQLQGANDFRIAAQRAKELYKKQNDGRLEGFEDWFNKTVDPAVFMLHRMSPSDQDQLIKKLNKTNKSGLKTLLGQMENAEKLGLFESQI